MTVNINYLPWRKAQRDKKKNNFIALLIGSGIITASVVGYYDFLYSAKLEYQNARIKFIEENNMLFEFQIIEIDKMKEDKKKILERARIIDELENDRFAAIKMLDYITKKIPDSIYIKEFKIQGDEIEILGVSKSAPDISSFMRLVEKSEWFVDPKMVYVLNSDEKKDGVRESEFLLTASKLSFVTKDGGVNETSE